MLVHGQTPADFVRSKDPHSLELMLAAMLPVVKVSHGRYLIGAEVREVHLRGDSAYVRTGGGFTTLKTFIV